MKLQLIPELLDTDSGSPSEIAAAFSDLAFINRWFGGFATTEAMIRRVARVSGSRVLSLLEVAAGTGRMPNAIQRRMQAEEIHLHFTLLDRHGLICPTAATAMRRPRVAFMQWPATH
jgi:hypothetical protein